MSWFNQKKSEKTNREIREYFDPSLFDGERLDGKVTVPMGHLANLLRHSEIRRLDSNDRLDQLIELQRETLETQKAILDELRKR